MTTTVLNVVSTTLLIGEVQQEADFEAATTVAQIFSGIVFTGLGIWMLISNGTKFSYIQRASLEKRLGTCCAIDTYVALFSAFFNFFQLTEVDDLFLPRPGGFVLDFSRPIEWIVTCPMMQVVLVLMGGSRIPEYRRILMPGLSLTVLACGTTSMLTGSPVRFVFYVIGLCFAATMFTLNGKQIMEHSNGQENLWVGDSEFRKASVLLIVTWVPFPLWFFCSPEGVGLIDNVLVIQMGWAFLNIVSKFTFIFYIQRVKDNYCNRLKVKRELLGVNPSGGDNSGLVAMAGMLGIGPSSDNPLSGKSKTKENELAAVVIETMNFLGMAQHNDRFLRLLKEAKVSSVEMVESLSKEDSDKLQLPWDLMTALQKRIKVWRLEMTDNAEVELERGEAHYQAATPTGAAASYLPGEVEGDADELRGTIARALAAGIGRQPTYSMDFQEQVAEQFQQMAGMMSMLQQQIEDLNNAQMRRAAEMEGSIGWKVESMLQQSHEGQQSELKQEIIAQVAERTEASMETLGRTVMAKIDSMQAAQARSQAENEASLMQRLGQMVQKASEQSVDTLGDVVGAKLDMSQAATLRQTAETEENLAQRVESAIQKASERAGQRQESSAESLGNLLQAKMDSVHAAALRKQSEMEASVMNALESLALKGSAPFEKGSDFSTTLSSRMADMQATQLKTAEDSIRRKVEEIVHEGVSRLESSVIAVQKMMEKDLGQISRGNDIVTETVRTSSDTHAEGLADLRRMSMMVLEQSSAALDKSTGSLGKMDLLQGSLDSGMGRIFERIAEMGGGTAPSTPRVTTGSVTWNNRGSEDASRRPSSAVSESRRPSKSSRYGQQVING